MAPIARIPRRYLVELSLAMAFYIAALFGRVFLLRQIGDPRLAGAIILLPILPICLMGLVIFRFYRGVDEFYRLRLLKIAAIAAGVTAASVASWNFLTDVGVPPLTNFGVLNILAGTFCLAGFLFRVEDAYSDGRIGRFVRSLTWLSTFVSAGAAVWFAVANILGQPLIVPLSVAICAAIVCLSTSLHIGPPESLV